MLLGVDWTPEISTLGFLRMTPVSASLSPSHQRAPLTRMTSRTYGAELTVSTLVHPGSVQLAMRPRSETEPSR